MVIFKVHPRQSVSESPSFLRVSNTSPGVCTAFCPWLCWRALGPRPHFGCCEHTAVIMGVQISVPLSAHSSLGHVPVVALLDPVVILCLIFLGTARLFATAAAPLAIPIRCARGFWFLQIGGRSISCSRSRGWGTGRGEVTCAHTAHMQTRIWAWWSDGLPLEPLTQTRDEVQRLWDAVQGIVHGFKPRPSAVKAHVVKHLGLNISVCFFPCLSKFML